MKKSLHEEKTTLVIYFLIIILPFLLFYWMVPFIADKSIGLDYQTTHIENQMELMFSISNGSFPLYVPGFALGHSSSALTLGEVFHPLPHIASLLPGYWDGQALQWNTLLRLLSLGLTHLALFSFLRKLKLDTLIAFLLSLITVYNLRMLDLFRYGASLETYTAHLLLCTAIGWYFISPTKVLGPICIIGSTYLLVCSGHPQMMYYGLLGAGLFLIIIPFFISDVLPEKVVNLRAVYRFWLRTGFFLFLGIALSLAYILPFYFEFIAMNAERVGRDYAWADSIRDTLTGTLSNFFMLFRSDVHGAFGGSSIIIMAALLPLLGFLRVKIPRVIWVIWGLALFVFLYMQGSRTPVHHWIWEYLPFASSFRYSGRISLIMPVLLMLLLAWILKASAFPGRLRWKSVELTPAGLLAALSLLAVGIYLYLVTASYFFHWSAMLDFAPFTPVAIRKIPRFIEILVLLSGVIALVALALYDLRKLQSKAIGILLCLTTFIQIGFTLKYGTWITERRDQPTFEQMQEQKQKKLDYYFYPGTGMYSSIVTKQLENSFMEPFLGKIFTEVIPVSSQDDAYLRMGQFRSPQQIFIEGYKPVLNTSLAVQESHPDKCNVELVYSSFNRLQFRVYSPESAFFSLSYPYTGHWNAWLNERKLPVYRANGAAHAIAIPAGESLIEFRYWSPWAFWGMIISSITFLIIGLYSGLRSFRGILKITVIAFVLGIGTGGFFIWYDSLYNGDNLNTKYAWAYEPPSHEPNIAYGKKTSMSSSLRGSPGYYHSSRAVDGDRSNNTGFTTAPEVNPTWSVDLNSIENIKTIVLYESSYDFSVNKRPIDIFFSDDSTQWRPAATITSAENQQSPIRIDFKTHPTARYIQIRASGFSSLRFDEVEVYPSKWIL